MNAVPTGVGAIRLTTKHNFFFARSETGASIASAMLMSFLSLTPGPSPFSSTKITRHSRAAGWRQLRSLGAGVLPPRPLVLHVREVVLRQCPVHRGDAGFGTGLRVLGHLRIGVPARKFDGRERRRIGAGLRQEEIRAPRRATCGWPRARRARLRLAAIQASSFVKSCGGVSHERMRTVDGRPLFFCFTSI